MAEAPGKKDALRLSIEQALSTVSKVNTQFNSRYNLGPSKTEITAKDVRLAYQNMDPMTKLNKIDQMGLKEWDAHMERLYNG
jgi:hypothetical protein